MKSLRWILPASALGLVAVLAAGSAQAAEPGSVGHRGDGWVDADAPRRIREYAAAIEAHTGWVGLGDYLAATAYTESRGDRDAVGDSGRSWGWFQVRPAAKCMQWLGLEGPELLGDEALQVVVAACHAYRLGTVYDAPGQRVQWRDVRRGWKYPEWVDQAYRDVPETEGNEDRLRRALIAVGISPDFRFSRAFPPGFQMLPVDYLLGIVRGVSTA